MIWLVSTRNEIVQNEDELLARSDYIREVMNVVPNEWKIISAMNSGNKYYMCQTNDTYNGAIITGHIGEVIELVYTNLIENIDFIVANTCIWKEFNDKQILYNLMTKNRKVKLWFAKQCLTLEKNGILRRTNMLSQAGNFGFPTSKSERILYMNRKKGFEDALAKAYDVVSPVILQRDYKNIVI